MECIALSCIPMLSQTKIEEIERSHLDTIETSIAEIISRRFDDYTSTPRESRLLAEVLVDIVLGLEEEFGRRHEPETRE